MIDEVYREPSTVLALAFRSKNFLHQLCQHQMLGNKAIQINRGHQLHNLIGSSGESREAYSARHQASAGHD